MNTRVLAASVLSRRGRRTGFLMILSSAYLGISSLRCVEVDGGAAELSWSIRAFDGDPVDCQQANIERVRLCWRGQGAEPDSEMGQEQFREFRCDELTGSTLFEIPAGRTEFFVKPICQNGLPAEVDSYRSPSSIARTVSEGEIVTLNSLLIVVTKSGNECNAECACVSE